MESNVMCSQLFGASAVVTGVPARLRTVTPIFGSVAQKSAFWQLGVVLDGMRLASADVPTTYAPKHAPRTFALSGLRTCDPPV